MAGPGGGREPGTALLEVLAAIADAVTPAEVYSSLVDRVSKALGASSMALWLVSDNRATLVRSRGYSETAEQAMQDIALDGNTSLPVKDCILTAKPIWIPSQEELYQRYPHLEWMAMGQRSFRVSCLPLLGSDGVLGSLSLTIEDAGQASNAEREFLLLVARYATQAIERLRLYEVERETRRQAEAAIARLHVFNRASRAFSDAALDLASRLRAVVAELAQALDSCINLGLIQEDGLLHVIAAHHPAPEAHAELQRLLPGHPLRMGEGVTGKIAATGESVFLPRIEAEMVATLAAPASRQFLARFPVYAMVGAALRVQGKVIGTVTAARVREGQSYEEDDVQLLEQLAERAAVAIENGRLYQESEEARTRLEHLYRFAQAVAAADRTEVVYKAAFETVEAALGVGQAAILICDEKRAVELKAWRNLSDACRADMAGRWAEACDVGGPQPMVLDDALHDPGLRPLAEIFRREGISSLVFLPLATQARPLGTLMLSADAAQAFSPPRLVSAQTIANHLASVIARFDATAKLEDTIRYNELLTGALAHDLRNPLNSIMVASQLLLQREGQRAATAAGPLGRVIAAGQRMTRMIEQLLDFTHARSGGGIRLEIQDTNLEAVCAQAIGELELIHPDWQIRSGGTGNLWGRWDAVRLAQVFSNLISNAGQHGRKDEPIAVTLDGTATDEAIIRIRNGGVISAEILPHIFDPFHTTRERRDQSSGLGLGLFIVREIIGAHAGSIDISSDENRTTVVIRLPR